MSLEVAQETRGQKWTVLKLSGRLDANSADSFKQRIKDLMAQGNRHFVLDFAQLKMLSSTGLNALLHLFRELEKQGGELRIAGIQAYVKEIFDLTGYSKLFKLFDSVEAAEKD
ncbi:MAG: STAS domain-containing protein [Candidatus Xenobia bacterium]